MKSSQALRELRALREAAAHPEVRRDGPEHDAWKAKVSVVMRGALGDASSTLKRFGEVRYHVGIWSGAPGEREADARYFAQQVARAAALIDAAIYEVEIGSEDQPDAPASSAAATPIGNGGPIFLVHGHDGSAKHDVARFVERITGKVPVILDEQANRGSTLVEKLEQHAAESAFAIVLLTPDDLGRAAIGEASAETPRARQNVILEMGYFFGKLGRDRVAVLNSGVEKPSDVDGLVYIAYPNSNWQVDLAKEFHAAGIPVDMKRLL